MTCATTNLPWTSTLIHRLSKEGAQLFLWACRCPLQLAKDPIYEFEFPPYQRVADLRLTIVYTDSIYASRFSIIDRIRLSHPTSCHCGDCPNSNPYYISSAGFCCGCQVGTLYHRIHKEVNRSRGTRWNLLTKSRSTRCAPVLPVPCERPQDRPSVAAGSLSRGCNTVPVLSPVLVRTD